MGSASSVSNDTAFAPPISIGTVADGEAAPSAEEFSARAQLLASKYHDLRLHGTGDVGGDVGVEGEGGASPSLLGNCTASSTDLPSRSSPSPLPRAERKRMSRQLQRHQVVEQNGGRRATVITSTLDDG